MHIDTGVKNETRDICPEEAKKILDRNLENNRNVSKIWVSRLAKRMVSGEWKLNGESIKISKDGSLLDGQHRLRAIIEAGVSIPVCFVSGLDKNIFDTLDDGKKRSGKDIADIKGRKNSSNAATVVRLLETFERTKGIRTHVTLSNFEMNFLLEKFDVVESIKIGIRYRNNHKNIPTSIISFTHYICNEISALDAELFFESFISGECLKKGDPVLALQRRINKCSEPGTHFLDKRDYWVRLIFKAWNAYRKGQSIKNLTIKDLNLETFPHPI